MEVSHKPRSNFVKVLKEVKQFFIGVLSDG